MHYFAGLFDAEGYVTLTNKGNYLIGMEMTNKEPLEKFKDVFGGVLSQRSRENKRLSYVWRLNADDIPYFIAKLEYICMIKGVQLTALDTYLRQTRERRAETRSYYVKKIASFKKPGALDCIDFHENIDDFFQWFAGFLDGDGNFCVYESTYNKKWIQFASYIGCYNIFKDVVCYIKNVIDGSLSVLNQNKNSVYKWAASQTNILKIAESVYPFLIVKKEQCRLLMEYQRMKKPNRFVQYSDEQKSIIRDIIKQIKHQNTL